MPGQKKYKIWNIIFWHSGDSIKKLQLTITEEIRRKTLQTPQIELHKKKSWNTNHSKTPNY